MSDPNDYLSFNFSGLQFNPYKRVLRNGMLKMVVLPWRQHSQTLATPFDGSTPKIMIKNKNIGLAVTVFYEYCSVTWA